MAQAVLITRQGDNVPANRTNTQSSRQYRRGLSPTIAKSDAICRDKNSTFRLFQPIFYWINGTRSTSC
jgi:hypothetical protein